MKVCVHEDQDRYAVDYFGPVADVPKYKRKSVTYGTWAHAHEIIPENCCFISYRLEPKEKTGYPQQQGKRRLQELVNLGASQIFVRPVNYAAVNPQGDWDDVFGELARFALGVDVDLMIDIPDGENQPEAFRAAHE